MFLLNIVMIVSNSVQAESVSLPHVFTDGKPAVAAEVNSNFDILLQSTNSHSERIESFEQRLEKLNESNQANSDSINNLSSQIPDALVRISGLEDEQDLVQDQVSDLETRIGAQIETVATDLTAQISDMAARFRPCERFVSPEDDAETAGERLVEVIASLQATCSSGFILRLGVGEYRFASFDLPSRSQIVGAGPRLTTLTTTGISHLRAYAQLKGLRINRTAADIVSLNIHSGSQIENIIMSGDNSGWNVKVFGRAKIRDLEILNNPYVGVFAENSSQVDIYASKIRGQSGLFALNGAVVKVYQSEIRGIDYAVANNRGHIELRQSEVHSSNIGLSYHANHASYLVWDSLIVANTVVNFRSFHHGIYHSFGSRYSSPIPAHSLSKCYGNYSIEMIPTYCPTRN